MRLDAASVAGSASYSGVSCKGNCRLHSLQAQAQCNMMRSHPYFPAIMFTACSTNWFEVCVTAHPRETCNHSLFSHTFRQLTSLLWCCRVQVCVPLGAGHAHALPHSGGAAHTEAAGASLNQQQSCCNCGPQRLRDRLAEALHMWPAPACKTSRGAAHLGRPSTAGRQTRCTECCTFNA